MVRQLTHKARARKTPDGPVDTATGAVRTLSAVATAAHRATATASAPPTSHFAIWEEVTGAFQVSIPVSTQSLLFDAEIRLLSMLRWILGTIPASDRWFLPFRRYVAEIGQRVEGFGGDPGSVKPDPNGLPGGTAPGGNGESEPEAPTRPGHVSLEGKITALLYDGWGDFEGFVLDTGHKRLRFESREHTIEDLADRAWTQRILVAVFVYPKAPQRPEAIVFRYAPRPHWG